MEEDECSKHNANIHLPSGGMGMAGNVGHAFRLCFEMLTNCIHCCPDSAVTHWSPAILPPYDKNIFGKRCLASVESGWDGWKWGPMGAGCV